MFDFLKPSWFSLILLGIIIIFIFWLLSGGKDQKFVGIRNIIDDDVREQVGYILDGRLEGRNKITRINENPITPLIPTGDYIDRHISQNITTEKKFSNDEIPRKKKGKSSKGEHICRKTLEYIFQDEFPNIRPNFLRNPKTGRNLELDCYNKRLGLAIEYKGIQHYEFPNWTKCTREEFDKQVRRDNWKLDECDKNHVYLVSVPYTIHLEDIYEYVRERIPSHLHKHMKI